MGDVSSLEEKSSPLAHPVPQISAHQQAPAPQPPRVKETPAQRTSSSKKQQQAQPQAQTPLPQTMPGPAPDYNMAFYDTEMKERYER